LIDSVHPEMDDNEINDKVEEAIMDGGDLLVDSSQVFAQQIIDDRYKREEAKIALMYAREQRKELEQVFFLFHFKHLNGLLCLS
jgi:hypothetical protein